MSWKRVTSPFGRHVFVDFAVIAGLIALVNATFAPSDPGWFGVNPSPWLAIPILLGCRYGFAVGAMSGVATALALAMTANVATKTPLAAVFADRGYLFGAMIFIGGVCGEIQARFRRAEQQLTAEKENALARLRQLDGDLAILREGKAELERMLATRDSELATLDSDLRRLFDAEGDELFASLLLLLNRHVRVSEGAIYWIEGNQLARKAILGQNALLPEKTTSEKIQMAELAIRDRVCVTIPEFWKNATPGQTDYLLAAPFPDANGAVAGVLVVTAMPFIALNKKAIQLINLICRWSARILEARDAAEGSYREIAGAPGSKIFTPEFFRKNLELGFDSFKNYGLSASVVVFDLASPDSKLQAAFEKKLAAWLRAGDYAATFGWKQPHLVVLLPLTGERGAEIFVSRITHNYKKAPIEQLEMRAKVLAFDGQQPFEDFWRQLNHSHESAATR